MTTRYAVFCYWASVMSVVAAYRCDPEDEWFAVLLFLAGFNFGFGLLHTIRHLYGMECHERTGVGPPDDRERPGKGDGDGEPEGPRSNTYWCQTCGYRHGFDRRCGE